MYTTYKKYSMLWQFKITNETIISTSYRMYSRIGRNFFLIFFIQKLGCDLYGGHTWVKILI